MKKFKSILALTASVLALSAFAAPVSAFADEIINGPVFDDNPQTSVQTATHTENASYTVTIPATVEINEDRGDNYTGSAVISAIGKIGATDTLTVTAQAKENPVLTCTGDNTVTVPYSAGVAGGDISIFDNIAVLRGSGAFDEHAVITYSAAKADFTVAGDYTDTITFTIKYTAAP